MKKIMVIALSVIALSTSAWAKLPPLSDEAKGKAAEAAAKAAHAGKVDAYQLCKSQDKVAAHYLKSTKTASKDAKPAASPCVDPGAFVAAPPAAAPAVAAASAPAIASAPTDKDKKKP